MHGPTCIFWASLTPFSLQLYTKQPEATVPVPKLRLAAFERVHLKAGMSRVVNLSVLPETHAVVRDGEASGEATYAASASQFVETGALQLFVGGGQPDYFQGHVSATVQIKGEAALSTC
jgi:beta-glucosidase